MARERLDVRASCEIEPATDLETVGARVFRREAVVEGAQACRAELERMPVPRRCHAHGRPHVEHHVAAYVGARAEQIVERGDADLGLGEQDEAAAADAGRRERLEARELRGAARQDRRKFDLQGFRIELGVKVAGGQFAIGWQFERLEILLRPRVDHRWIAVQGLLRLLRIDHAVDWLHRLRRPVRIAVDGRTPACARSQRLLLLILHGRVLPVWIGGAGLRARSRLGHGRWSRRTAWCGLWAHGGVERADVTP